MDRPEIVKRLNQLIQLDVDAVEAYEQAVRHINYEDIREKLLSFQNDHRNHVQRLSATVRELNGEPVKATPDLKGYLIEGFTALRSLTGTEGALRAMEMNERLTNRKYRDAAELNLPEQVMRVIRENLAHEEIHLQFIEEILSIPRRKL